MQLTQQRICHKETEHRDLVQTDFPLHSILSSVFQNHMTDDVMMGWSMAVYDDTVYDSGFDLKDGSKALVIERLDGRTLG